VEYLIGNVQQNSSLFNHTEPEKYGQIIGMIGISIDKNKKLNVLANRTSFISVSFHIPSVVSVPRVSYRKVEGAVRAEISVMT
jgi:hypothetical protein